MSISTRLALGNAVRSASPSRRAARRQRRSLHQQREQHDEEGDVEEDVGLGHAGERRDGREKDRDRAAQPDPRDERLLPRRVAERRQAQPHRERPRDEGQRQRHEQPRNRVAPQRRGRRRAARARGTSRSGTATSPRRGTRRSTDRPASAGSPSRAPRRRPRAARCRRRERGRRVDRIAPATVSSGCSPPGIATRLSSATSPNPPSRPDAAPIAGLPAERRGHLPRRVPRRRPAMSSVSAITRNTANGSLVPLSISSVDPTRLCRRRPPVRSRKNTAAASVEATIDPSSSASTGARSSTAQAATPDRGRGQRDPERREQQRRREHAAKHRQSRPQAAVEQDHGERDRPDEVGRRGNCRTRSRPGRPRRPASRPRGTPAAAARRTASRSGSRRCRARPAARRRRSAC